MKKTLMILAGFPASGKTTLLRHSFENHVSLFGDHNQALFENTLCSMAEASPHNLLEIDPKLRCTAASKSLKSDGYLQNENHLIVHLDIYRFYKNYIFSSSQKPHFNKHEFQRLQDTPNRQRLVRSFLDKLFHSSFDHIVVNTILPLYPQNAQNYARRRLQRRYGKAPFHKCLFRKIFTDFPKRTVWKAYHDAWFNDLQLLNTSEVYQTSYKMNDYQIHRMMDIIENPHVTSKRHAASSFQLNA